jgi:hypothetical protein
MVVAAAGAVAAVAGAITQVKDTLEALDDERSVVLIVENFTNYTWEVHSTHHDHGGFAVNPTGQIDPKKAVVFGSKDKGFLTGTEGSVTYHAKEKPNLFVQVKWDNPFIGSNSCSTGAYEMKPAPPPLNQFFRSLPFPTTLVKLFHSCGAGNQKAEMRYEIRPSN